MMTSSVVWRRCVVADFDLVIFDWDGTLMDSIAQIVASVRAAADDLGVSPPSDAAARDIIGLGLPEAMRVLFPQVPEAEREALRQRYATHFVGGTGGRSQPYAGADQLLQRLQGQQRLLERLLQGLPGRGAAEKGGQRGLGVRASCGRLQ